jgi:hypothetical protein
MTLEHLRRSLHAELRHARDERDKHFRLAHFSKDEVVRMPGAILCDACVRFQERIRTLNFALEQAGGRKMDDSYQWGPVEGA